MKHLVRLGTLIGVVLFSMTATAQTTIYTLDFETAGGYTTSITESSNNEFDFFTRTDGSNISVSDPSDLTLSGQQGSYWFGASHITEAPTMGGDTETLDITGIDITGYDRLQLTLMLAEIDASSEDWDPTTGFAASYRIDGGEYVKFFAIESSGDIDTEPGEDTNLKGSGNEGARVTSTFQDFEAAIAGTGTTLDLRFTFDTFNDNGEDIAMDNIRISGEASQTPIYTVDFEAASGYTATECSEGVDVFSRESGVNLDPLGLNYINPQGSYFFAANDLDGASCTTGTNDSFEITGVDITGKKNLELGIWLAEDRADDEEEDWDRNTSFNIEYQIDGGGYTKFFAVESSSGTADDTEPSIDTDLDGIGDGTPVIATFREFFSNISGNGGTLDLRFNFENFNITREDIAIDNIRIFGDDIAAPTVANALPDLGPFEPNEKGIQVDIANTFSSEVDMSFEVTSSNPDVATASFASLGSTFIQIGVLEGGTTTVTVTATNVNGELSVQDAFTVTVNKLEHPITFPTVDRQMIDGVVTLSAATTITELNGNAPTFEVVSGPGEVSGDQLTFSSFGTVQVRATIAGNGVYEDGTATQNIVVGRPNIRVADVEFFSFGTATTDFGTRTYNVSGTELIGNITINAPAEVRISLSETENFGDEITLSPTDGTIESTNIYVRFTNPITDFPSFLDYQISHTSDQAATRNAAVAVAICEDAEGNDVCAVAEAISSTEIRLRWLPRPGSSVVTYQVIGEEEGTTLDLENPSSNKFHIENIPSGQTSMIIDQDTGGEALDPGTTYNFRVRYIGPEQP